MSTLRVATVVLVAMQLFGCSHDVGAASLPSECEDADPARVLANISGDFELTADPQDPLGNLIYVANAASGASDVVVARIDRLTGKFVGGSLTTVATNFSGETRINGPEFVQQPDGSFGIIYRGPQGVHAVFRSNPPSAWNNFAYNVNGDPLAGSPPPLPSTEMDNYPGAGMPFGQSTYAELNQTANKAFFGPLRSGQLTDMGTAMAAQGLTLTTAAQSPREGYIFMIASHPDSGPGIYEAQINGAGGFTSGTLVKLATTATTAPWGTMRAIRHPLTGSTVLFTNAGNDKISIWKQPSSGGMLTLINTVTATNNDHYRTEEDASKVVLHYLVRKGSAKGSYTLPVTASGTTLVAGVARKISTAAAGAELAWLPVPNKWALYYRSGAGSNGVTRCFVTP